ncbi:hypothetical protein [Cecembia rubra]|uniref:Uncharacterized protein n=1 Tax=Cecembia rubra TaxID=1485585 RepID=A0A2P8E338_9BACT|nr:hypothetical protein [Cecembia rubra]PSL03880.1 hypothetical protein CLV48_106120 [Cecembia rubra]
MEKLNIFQNLEKTQKAIVLKRLKEMNDDLGQKISKIPKELIPDLITELETDLTAGGKESPQNQKPEYTEDENSTLNEAVKSIFR